MTTSLFTATSGPLLFASHAPGQLGSLFKRARIERESPEFTQSRQNFSPKVIVALGEDALQSLTGHANIFRYRGFVLDGPDGIPVVSTFHPDFLRPKRGEQSSAKWTGTIMWDLLRAEQIGQHGFTREPVEYLIDPGPNETARFVDEYLAELKTNPLLPLGWDIETPGKVAKKNEDEVDEIDYTITRVNFSFRPRYALTVPNMTPFVEVIRTLLATSGPKVGWNDAIFDRPVVAKNGWELNGDLHDAMNAWHVLQPALPKKLELVSSFYAEHLRPWKHLAKSDFGLYAAIDADATITNWLGIVKGLLAIRIPEYTEAAA